MGVSTVLAANAKKCCLVQDVLLEEVIGGIYPQKLQPRTWGTTSMLAAAESSPGVMKIDTHTVKAKPTASSATKWEIRYKAKRCPTAPEAQDPCDTVTADLNPWKYAQPTLGDPLYFEFAIDWEDYRTICEGPQDFLNEHMLEAYESLKTQSNQRYIDQLIANLGNYYSPGDAACASAVDSGDNPRTLSILDVEGRPQPRGLYQVIQQYRRMGITTRPMMVAGTPLDAMDWQDNLYINTTDELTDRNTARFANRNLPGLFVDYDIDETFADASYHGISMVPGAAMRLFWNEFEGYNGYSSDTLVRRTFDLGALFGDSGFVVDQAIYVDECAGRNTIVYYKFYLYTDLFWLPADLFNTTDCGQCSNYLLNWLIDCATLNCSNFTGGFEPPST